MSRITKPIILLLIFMFTLLSGISISKSVGGSPFDEVAHADLVYSTYANHHLFVPGSTLNDWTVAQAGCRGFIPASPSPENCLLGPYDKNLLAGDGLNTASGYPPVFYILSATITWVLTELNFNLDWNLLRLSSIIIFSLGACITYLLMYRVSKNIFLSVISTVWLTTIPILIFQGSTINPESASLFFGSSVIYAAISLKTNKLHSLLFGVLLSLALLTKPTFIFAAIPAFFIYSNRGLKDKSTNNKISGYLTSTITFVVLLAFNVAWELHKKFTQLPIMKSLKNNETFGQLASDISLPKRIVIAIKSYLNVAGDLTQKPNFDTTLGYQIASLTGFIVVVGIIFLGLLNLLNKNFESLNDLLTASAALGLFLGSGVLVISTQFLTNIFFVTGRYALPIMPLIVAALAAQPQVRSMKSIRAKLLLATLVLIQISYLQPVQHIFNLIS